MNFKKQAIVAAAILAVAGVANAKPTTIEQGNSSLAFIAIDTVAKTSTFVDLGTTFAAFLPQGTNVNVQIPGDGTVASGFQNTASALTYTPGSTLSWDFSTNTFKVNGATQTTALNGKTIDWSPFNTFKAATAAGSTKWGVIGGGYGMYNTDPTLDVNGYGVQGPSAQIITTGPTTATFDFQTIAGAAGKVTTLFANNSIYGTNADVTKAGASVRSVGQSGYVGNDFEMSVAGTWGNQLAFSALNAINGTSNFYYTNELALDGLTQSGTTSIQYAGQFAFNGTTLSYTVPTAAVPEPEGFALALVGLAAVGFVARRRQA